MLFISSTIIQMRATQHFHRGLLLGTTRIKKKINSNTHWNIFGVFGFLEQANKKGKQKMRKTIYAGKLPTAEEEQGNIFGFSF